MAEENKIIKAKIIALSPLHIGTGRVEGTFHPCMDYIPARVLRGVLGNYLYNHDKKLFDDLKINKDSLETNILFKPALPENKVAMPKILRWCKGCNKLLIEKYDEKDKSCDNEKCLQEGSSRSGFFTLDEIKNKQLHKKDDGRNKKTIVTKCPIIRETHTSPKEGLSPYHIEALNKGAKFDFWCVVKGNFDVKEHLKNAGLFYGVGGFTSRGYGTILFENFEEHTEEEYKKELIKNFELDKKALMVLNSPAIFKTKESTYRIGFDKKEWGDGKAAISETHARGWSIEGNSHISDLIPATASGSCIEVDKEIEEQTKMMIYGIGEQTHIYGDVYFIPQKIYKKG